MYVCIYLSLPLSLSYFLPFSLSLSRARYILFFLSSIWPYFFSFPFPHVDKAYEISQDMELNGPEPNIYTYNTVTRAFAQAGRLEVQ